MRKLFIVLLLAQAVVVSACSQVQPVTNDKSDSQDRFVFVQGGTFTNTKSNYNETNETVSSFYMSKYEVTQQEWVAIMGSNPSSFQGEDLPVDMVSWYDAVEYSNLRSIQEGLQPYYNIDKNKQDPDNISEYDSVQWTVTINEEANGYRLPTEAEWEYAAGGGQSSNSYTYSGSNDADEVAWNWRNAGEEYLSGDWNWPMIENNKNQTKPVGLMKPNELGLYDMSGNVREWCWDWYEDAETDSGAFRVVRGGGWIGGVNSTEVAFRGKFEANGYGPDQGFRLARNE